jgi:hypothetical protein
VTIEDVRTDSLRIPLSQPIADSTHVLRFIDLILVEIRAGDHVGTSYMLSFDYAPALLKGIIEDELKRHVLGQPADAIGASTSEISRPRSTLGRRESQCGESPRST